MSPPAAAAAAALVLRGCAGLCGELVLPLPLLLPVTRVCSGDRCVPGAGVLCGCSCRGSMGGSMPCWGCVLTLLWRDNAGEDPRRDDAE